MRTKFWKYTKQLLNADRMLKSNVLNTCRVYRKAMCAIENRSTNIRERKIENHKIYERLFIETQFEKTNTWAGNAY